MPRRSRTPVILSVIAASAALGGCASQSKTSPPIGPSQRSDGRPTGDAADGRLIDPIDNPQGQTRSLKVRAGLMVLGEVPYDGFVLPLISPDGQFAATQTSSPPDWPTTLAEAGQQPPVATLVETYSLDPRQDIGADERIQPQRLAHVLQPVLLGRGCDAEGFLVEAPQDDGSRWIGKADWTTAQAQWLVRDDSVNAFAALAPDGRMAWSRRAKDLEHFDLIVRDAQGEEWTLPGKGGDWLMPVWASSGDGLFALHRQDGRLRLCYGQAKDPRTFQVSMRDFTLMAKSDRYAAYQAFIVQGSLDGTGPTGQPSVLVFHPGLGRMILWKPLLARNASATQLNAGSLAALQQAADSVIVCTTEELLLQSLRQADSHILLSTGTWVPRRTPQLGFPYVVLSPGEGRIQITALKLLPIEDARTLAMPAEPR